MVSAAEQLKSACASGRAMHGCLVTSADPEAASKLVSECASLLLFGNENTDALKLSADYFDLDGSVKIDELRFVRQELYKQTFGGKSRVVVIRNAHFLKDNAINAMLKMLEEPPAGTYFFLTGIEQRILPTVRSRCLTVRLGTTPLHTVRDELSAIGASRDEAALYAAMGMGIASRSVKLYTDTSFRALRTNAINALIDMLAGKLPFNWAKSIGKDRGAARECVEFMLGVCHDLLMLVGGGQVDINLDVKDRLTNIAAGFTTNRISGIINKLVDAAMRLNTNASSNLTLDGLIVEITEARKWQTHLRESQ